jgi:hypothetical protein
MKHGMAGCAKEFSREWQQVRRPSADCHHDNVSSDSLTRSLLLTRLSGPPVYVARLPPAPLSILQHNALHPLIAFI